MPGRRALVISIDPLAAIDLVAGAVRGEYEVGILMSTDTDLKPALEFVRDLEGDPYPRHKYPARSAIMKMRG